MKSSQQARGTMWKGLSSVTRSSRKDCTRRTRFRILSGISWNRHSRMLCFNPFPLSRHSVMTEARSNVSRKSGAVGKKNKWWALRVCRTVHTVHSGIGIWLNPSFIIYFTLFIKFWLYSHPFNSLSTLFSHTPPPLKYPPLPSSLRNVPTTPSFFPPRLLPHLAISWI